MLEDDAQILVVPQSRPSAWIHPDRIAGGDCDYRRARFTSTSGCSAGPGSGPPGAVQEQPQTDRPGASQLSRHSQGFSPGAFISAVNYAQMSNIVADVFEKGEVPLILVLDRITDVRNFGAIARTAECSGVHAIVVPARGGSQVNEDAMKTSSGALNYLPVCRENDLVAAIEELKMSGFSIVACTEKSDKNIYGAALNGPTAIVMGSEEDGISDRILELSDERVKIPMFGNVGSLNVSAATAVLLYEVVRQRTQE